MSYDPDYSPFPESELLALAEYFDSAAKQAKSGYLHHIHLERAAVCRSAIKSQTALRERCLVAEMELGQAQLRLNAGNASNQAVA